MCVYCFCGDWAWKYNPPWVPSPPNPLLPQPVNPLMQFPWTIPQLKEFEELLKRIKALEDQLGCPCEPNKADHLGLLRGRIEELEKKQREPKSRKSDV